MKPMRHGLGMGGVKHTLQEVSVRRLQWNKAYIHYRKSQLGDYLGNPSLHSQGVTVRVFHPEALMAC